MNPSRPWWSFGLLAFTAACSGNDPVVLVRVHVDQDAVSRCVVVVASDVNGGSAPPAQISATPGDAGTVAVFRGSLGNVATVRAEGHAGGDCSSAPDELSEQITVSFAPGPLATHDLFLQPEGPCDDEQDGDGDELVDCDDPACEGTPACPATGTDGGTDAGTDGGTDAGADAGGAVLFPYPPSNFPPAGIPVPDAGLVIDCAADYDTVTRAGFLCGAPVPPSYVIDGGAAGPLILLAVTNLTITGTGEWRITGTYPLVLAVYGNATIDGPLLGAALGVANGPGGGGPACPGAGGEGRDGGTGGGGGGGGGYGQRGGAGSPGAGASPAPGGDGGAGFGAPELVPLLGGCAGGAGGQDLPVAIGRPAGGGGGGAIQLSAAGDIQVSAAVGAPGGGGQTPNILSDNGGSGGGSGGAVLLEARRLVFAPTARITANGGAGGEGGDGTSSLVGKNGEDGRVDGPTPALGGASGQGPAGGDGGAGLIAAMPGVTELGGNFGGGGGGGGVGRIRVNALVDCAVQGSPGMTFSPPATSNKAGDAGCP